MLELGVAGIAAFVEPGTVMHATTEFVDFIGGTTLGAYVSDGPSGCGGGVPEHTGNMARQSEIIEPMPFMRMESWTSTRPNMND